MASINAVEADSQQEISIKDVVQFAKEFYKKILTSALVGLVLGLVGAIAIGSYTATITLNNYSGMDLPRIRYLQSALPKLEQENQKNKKNEETSFLSSES